MNELINQINNIKSSMNNLKKEIDNNETNINSINQSIKSRMHLDNDNNGLMDVKTGNTLNGINDEDFLDPYYDKDGNPTFYINQFNPLFANLLRHSDARFSSDGCNPASYTNALIHSLGVHSLVDTIGILSFFIKASDNLENHVLPMDVATTFLTGEGSDYNKRVVERLLKNESIKDSYSYLYKYLIDDNGNYKYKSTSWDKVANDVSNGQNSFVVTNLKNVDEFISQMEKMGYEVNISFASSEFKKNYSLFGSTGNSGHFGATIYDTGEGIAILDSYGNRTFLYERAEGINNIGWGGYNYNEAGNNGKSGVSGVNKSTASKNDFWHDTTVHIGTSIESFNELEKVAGMNTQNRLAIITLTKKK